MFDIGWSELFVIAVVALVVVGPKDLPRLLRTVGNMVAKGRRMSGDFQRQFNAALKEAEREVDLEDTRKAVAATQKTVGDVRRALVDPLRQMTPLKTGATGTAAAVPPPVVAPPAEPVPADSPLAAPATSEPSAPVTEPSP